MPVMVASPPTLLVPPTLAALLLAAPPLGEPERLIPSPCGASL
jgi:hypothetical protein